MTAVYGGDSNFAGSSGTLAAGQTVNPASITVTADDQVKVYGDCRSRSHLSDHLGHSRCGDSFSGAIARNPGESAGPYAIQQGALALPAATA